MKHKLRTRHLKAENSARAKSSRLMFPAILKYPILPWCLLSLLEHRWWKHVLFKFTMFIHKGV